MALFFALMSFPIGAALVPMPREITLGEGEFQVDAQTTVIAKSDHAVPALVITTALQKTTGCLHRTLDLAKLGRIKMPRPVRLEIVKMEKEESYQLEIKPEGVTIKGSDPAGLMHGAQTFAQLLPVAAKPFPRVMVPSQSIEDWPETKRRVFKLDVSQHLFPTDELKGIIDWLSFHKLNEFHLKLNGDAGWRMESLKFPKLHEVGSVRRSTPPLADPTGSDSTEYGGYYTQENLRELVGYAKKRGIEVVPCFTFVTGASALIAAYPELGSEAVKVAATWEERSVGVKMSAKALEFFEQFFAELATVFPSKYVRLDGRGGAFHTLLTQELAKSGKTLFSARGVSSTNFSIYSRPEDAELFANPLLRADEGLNSLRQVYAMRMGQIAEANLRTRYVPDIAKFQYLVFPRIAAFAEATWLPFQSRNYDEFRTRADQLVVRYRTLGVQASAPYDPPNGEVIGGVVITTSMTPRETYGAKMVFDGRRDSFFWSEGALKKDDHLTLEFPWSIEGDISVASGRSGGAGGDATGILIDGVLDLSADGERWDAAAEFFDGLASVTVPNGTRFARIRVFSPQEDPLVLHEVVLSEPLLLPTFSEQRQVKLPLSGENITLTFKASFEKHPEFRDEIAILRRAFFEEWLPLSERLGLAHDARTPRTFEVREGEPGELSAEEARAWMRKRLIPQIQDYTTSSPLWFGTGMTSLLLGDVTAKPDRSQGLSGGAETAAFFQSIEKKYGPQVLMSISQDCRRGRYNEALWKVMTQKSLDELFEEYQSVK